jgi:hypothetical protein
MDLPCFSLLPLLLTNEIGKSYKNKKLSFFYFGNKKERFTSGKNAEKS